MHWRPEGNRPSRVVRTGRLGTDPAISCNTNHLRPPDVPKGSSQYLAEPSLEALKAVSDDKPLPDPEVYMYMYMAAKQKHWVRNMLGGPFRDIGLQQTGICDKPPPRQTPNQALP